MHVTMPNRRAILVLISAVLAASAGQSVLLAQKERQPAKDLAEKLPEGASARLGTGRLRALCTSIAYSADGKTLIGVDGGRLVRVWDAATGNLLETRVLPGRPYRAKWEIRSERSADGKTLLICERNSFEMWDIPSGKKLDVRLPKDLKHIDSVAFSDDRRFVFIVESSDPEPVAAAPAPGLGVGGGGALGMLGGGGLGSFGGMQEHVKKQDLSAWGASTGKQRLLMTTGKHRNFAEHENWLSAPVVSPNGKRLASSSGLETCVWDTATGKLLWQVKNVDVRQMAFTPDGRRLIGVPKDANKPWHAWDAETGQADERCQPPQENFGQSWILAVSPDGNVLFIGTNLDYVLWDLQKGKELRRWRIEDRGYSGVFAPDGRSVITHDTILHRWDVATGDQLYADVSKLGHTAPVKRFLFTADGKRLASVGEDRTIRIWDVPRAKLLHTIDLGATNLDAWTLTPDGATLIGVDDRWNVQHWSLANGQSPTRFRLDEAQKLDIRLHAYDIRVTPDGKTLAVSAWTPTSEYAHYKYSFTFWDVETGRFDHWGGDPGPKSYYKGNEALLSPDGRLAAYAGQLFDTRTGEIRLALPGDGQGQGSGIHVFSPDGRLLAAGWGNGVRVWEVATGRPLINLPREWCIRKGFSPDGRLLALADPDRFIVFDLATGKIILERPAPEYLRQHGYFAKGGIEFAPDGRTVATGHEDGTILLWDVPPPAKPDGALTERETANLWDNLADESPAKAYAAVWRLRQDPEEALRLLRKHLPPVERPTETEVRTLIRQLDSDQFDEREAATKQLKKMGRAAEDALRKALKDDPPAEQKRRIQELLVIPEPAAGPPKGEDLCAVRAVAVLELISTAPARQLLEDWAKGAPGGWLTEEAARGLTRVKRTNP